jgi:hypothetical protein
MNEEPPIQQLIGKGVVSPFIFRIIPDGCYIGLVPVEFLFSVSGQQCSVGITQISQEEFDFLRRVGIPEVVVVV